MCERHRRNRYSAPTIDTIIIKLHTHCFFIITAILQNAHSDFLSEFMKKNFFLTPSIHIAHIVAPSSRCPRIFLYEICIGLAKIRKACKSKRTYTILFNYLKLILLYGQHIIFLCILYLTEIIVTNHDKIKIEKRERIQISDSQKIGLCRS